MTLEVEAIGFCFVGFCYAIRFCFNWFCWLWKRKQQLLHPWSHTSTSSLIILHLLRI